MGRYLTKYWLPDGQGMNKKERMGDTYFPYVPNKLNGLPLTLEPSCANAVAEAQKALYQLDNRFKKQLSEKAQQDSSLYLSFPARLL